MKKIISIQSNVLSDLVGNQAASLVLGNLGYQVIQIPTIILSSHKGHKNYIEIPIKKDTPNIFFQSLKKTIKISKDDIFLVGYIPNTNIGKSVLKIVKNKKKFVLDPVMGDLDTGAYVSKDVIKFIPNIINFATHISLNFFEWCTLMKKSMQNYSLEFLGKDARAYCKKNNKMVFIRSIIRGNKLCNLIASKNNCFFIETPNIKFKKRIDGAGDISTALFTHYIFKNYNESKVLELVSNQMFEIIKSLKENKISANNLKIKKGKLKYKSKSLNNL